MLTELWVVVSRGKDGKPRGFEKVSHGRFHLTEIAAHSQLAHMPGGIRRYFMVARVFAEMVPLAPTQVDP